MCCRPTTRPKINRKLPTMIKYVHYASLFSLWGFLGRLVCFRVVVFVVGSTCLWDHSPSSPHQKRGSFYIDTIGLEINIITFEVIDKLV